MVLLSLCIRVVVIQLKRTRRARQKVRTPTGALDDRAGFGFSTAIRKQVTDSGPLVFFTFTLKMPRGKNTRSCDRYYSLSDRSSVTVWNNVVSTMRSHFTLSTATTTTDQRSCAGSRQVNQVWSDDAKGILKRLRFGKNPVTFSRIAAILSENGYAVERYVLVC